MRWYRFFFFVSGSCSILYELIWLRLAMAQFGVTTALVSVVLSVFMAGLGLGSWASGAWLRKYARAINFPALRLYALAELLIGVSAIVVPLQLQWGRHLLERTNLSSSQAYYVASGIWIALTLIPWSAAMGATIPLAMFAIRQTIRPESARSFSYLYLANVFGAVLGTGVSLILIELLGFQGSLHIGAVLNLLLAGTALALTFGRGRLEPRVPSEISIDIENDSRGQSARDPKPLVLLFTTGLTAMGMELVWIRQYTPYLGTVVYAFALILAIYLAATFVGSKLYRDHGLARDREPEIIWSLLGLVALFPLVTADPALHLLPVFRLVFGIGPFTMMLGFVTPMLVDRWSAGSPARAGSAYAVNVLGCILGPLLAGFVLLPLMSERWALFALSLPWLIYAIVRQSSKAERKTRPLLVRVAPYLLLLMVSGLMSICKGFEQQFPNREVLRDHTATIIAASSGKRKMLLVNGVGITSLSPVTKIMAHLPLAFLNHPPQSALAICFGMGTTYRSLLSWDIPVTAVDLVPSVPRMFGYYHPDGPQLLRSPLSHVVIDDGRRYLERSPQLYDVVTIDPPPPVEAAGSSLLYSEEFYAIARKRLRSGGILQQWLPSGDAVDISSIARALKDSFPCVRVFHSVEHWGFHFLASEQPIYATAEQLVHRMPEKAAADLVEWGPEPDAERQFAAVLDQEISIDQLIAGAARAPALRDDHPVNEYYLLRRHLPRPWRHLAWQEAEFGK